LIVGKPWGWEKKQKSGTMKNDAGLRVDGGERSRQEGGVGIWGPEGKGKGTAAPSHGEGLGPGLHEEKAAERAFFVG